MARLRHPIRFLWIRLLRARRWWILPILAVAIWLRWGGLEKSAWEDEVHSFIESRPGADNPVYKTTGAVPTAYWTSFQVFRLCDHLIDSGSIRLVRLPVLLLGLLGIWCAWRLGRVWRNWAMGAFLALILALWPFKIYWDIQVRYYGVAMALTLALLLAWESYRARPLFGRFLAGLVLTVLACLAHILAVILVAVPGFYLAWETLCRPIRLLRRRERFRGWLAAVFSLAGQWALFGFAALCIVQFNRGPDWLADAVVRHTDSPPPVLNSKIPSVAKLGAAAAEPAATGPTIPKIGDAMQYTAAAFEAAAAPDAWSPGPLLDLQDQRSHIFTGLVLGPQSNWSRHDTRILNIVLSVALIAGSLTLLFVSPPLLAALWFIILATSISIHFNQNWIMATRYFTLPGLAGAMLAAAGLGGALRLVQWPLRRANPRLAAAVTLAAVLAAGIGFTLSARGIGKVAAGVELQQWSEFYDTARRLYPNGILFTGIGSKNISFYNRLAKGRANWEARAPWLAHPTPSGYWDSPWRNTILDPLADLLQDEDVLDYCNGQEAIAIFNYDYWNGDYQPFRQRAGLLGPPAAMRFSGINASLYHLGNKVFVMRGEAALPLLPRLLVQPAARSTSLTVCRMQCCFEVPGPYELTIGESGDARPIAVAIDGKPCEITQRRVRPRGAASATSATAGAPRLFDLEPTSATSALLLRGLADESARLGAAGSPAPTPAPAAAPAADLETGGGVTEDNVIPRGADWAARWRRGAAGEPPVDFAPKYEYAVQADAPATPLAPLEVSITFARPPAGKLPVLRWALQNQSWQTVTSRFDAGDMRRWQDGDRFYFSLPLRLRQDPQRGQTVKLMLIDLQTGEVLKTFETQLYPRRRNLRAGDIQWAGPLTLPVSQALAAVNHNLVLALLPVVFNAWTGHELVHEEITSPRRIFPAPNSLYKVCFLKFRQSNGYLLIGQSN